MSYYCITEFNAVSNPVVSESCFACATRNLILNKGSTFGISFTLTKDGVVPALSGYSVRSAIKSSYDSLDNLVYMSTSNQMIVLDTTDGTVNINIPEKITRRLPGATGVYDIELIAPNGETTQIIKGTITFNNQVTT